MLFNPFKLYDEMLGIYTQALTGNDTEEEWVTCEYTVPEKLADKLDTVVAKFLRDNGYDE